MFAATTCSPTSSATWPAITAIRGAAETLLAVAVTCTNDGEDPLALARSIPGFGGLFLDAQVSRPTDPRVDYDLGNTRYRLGEEAGDLLFTLVNLCRFAGVDAEAALRISLGKFTQRFAQIERELAAEGKTPADSTLTEMDRLWNEAKKKPTEGTP